MILLMLLACDRGYSDPTREFAEPIQGDREYPVVVHEPENRPVITEPLKDEADREVPAGSACSVCHEPVPAPADVDIFHTSVEVEHGELTCGQCHDPLDRNQLHLADGQAVDFLEVVTLCTQCHGRVKDDFENGAHGGVNGYWDTRIGPKERNGCLDCHPAHAPKPPQVEPVFPPIMERHHE